MTEFPRTTVGGVSLPRMIIGTNWFFGFSHTSRAKSEFIRAYQTRERIADILTVFLERGIDACMSGAVPLMAEAIHEAEDRTGKRMTWIITASFRLLPEDDGRPEPEAAFDECKELGATFCMPHQCVTDALVDKMHKVIRDIDKYTKMIREREMIPGLSTHMPETVPYADNTGADVETYIQIYNAAGFMMQIEADWVMRIIRNAKKPVMIIKPLAAGRLLPVVGLAFVWSTIREQDMVTVGTMTPDEAREVIDISLDLLSRRVPDQNLQSTRSKQSLE